MFFKSNQSNFDIPAGQLLHKQNIVFFVQRDDTKEAVCFWRETDSNYTVLFHNGPVFDLGLFENIREVCKFLM